MPIELNIEDLIFDVQNPRFENVNNQRDALQKIIDDQKEKLFSLAEDIASQGLNPADLIMVLRAEKDSGKYIVLEGNRRLAALKLLSNPRLLRSLVISRRLKTKFEGLIKGFDQNVIEVIECALCQSKEEADHWRKLRHTGENRGAGIVSWDGMATARFTGKDVSLQALNFVRQQADVKIDDIDKFPITNLGRLLGNPYVRDVLGIGIRDGKLVSELPVKEVVKGLKKVIYDIEKRKINVNDIRTKEQREKYINELSSLDKPNKTEKISPWFLESAEKAPQEKTKKSKPQSTERKVLIPRDCVLVIRDPRSNAIYKELRDLNIVKFSNAISVLMRVFLEFTTDYYITERKLSLDLNDRKLTLRKKVLSVVDHLVNVDGVPYNDLKGIRAAVANPTSPFSIDTLHSYVHSRYFQPKHKDLLIDWNNVRIFFEKIWQ